MKLFKRYGNFLAAVMAVAVLYGVMFSLGITCPIKFLFGISCPGCGMTRAIFSAVTLDFSRAFYYHPLWVGVIPAGVTLFLLSKFKKQRAFKIVGVVCILVMLAVYVYRLMGDGSIVVFEWSEGVIFKAFEKIHYFLN